MPKTSRKRKSKNSNQTFDIIGMIMVFLGPIMLIFLASPDGKTGAVGLVIKSVLGTLFGSGAFVFPILCIVVGLFFIFGPITLWSRNAGIGTTMIFISVIGNKGFASLAGGQSVEDAGGIIGWLVAAGLSKGIGMLAGRIILWLIALIGIYVAFDVPLAAVITKIRDVLSNGAEAARNRIPVKAEAPKKNGKKAAAPPPVEQEDDEPKEKKRLLPILVRKGDKEEEEAVVAADERKIPVNVGALIKPKPKPIPKSDYEPDVEPGDYQYPPLSLLSDPPPPPKRVEAELKGNVETIERTLEDFGVHGDVVEIAHGPTVTRYEIRLAPGIKVNKIVSLADNLAMALAAIDVRVEAPIPGKSAIGVEVPNKHSGMVAMREVIDTAEFGHGASKLVFALGKDVSGNVKMADLTKMPHMLIGGSTNSGKSICLNTLILSLLYRATPDELKFILIDPKRVELSLFDGIPHLACPVVKDVRQAAGIFRAATKEMDNRYELIARAGCRNIQSYNEKMPEGEKLPYLVIVCDELADLMMQAAAEVETSICRLAQLARAVGIHLVIATQRPSVDVITGLIKANISSRIAFAVASQIDSRTILDQTGAERLIGRGDMLFLPIDAQKPIRVQGCYASEQEVHDVVEFLKAQRKPIYTIEVTDITQGGTGDDSDDAVTDEYWERAVRMIVTSGYASTSMIQRKFKIGYTRAARLVDAMEQRGIVGPLDGAKPREVLVKREDLDRLFGTLPPADEPVVGDGEDE